MPAFFRPTRERKQAGGSGGWGGVCLSRFHPVSLGSLWMADLMAASLSWP